MASSTSTWVWPGFLFLGAVRGGPESSRISSFGGGSWLGLVGGIDTRVIPLPIYVFRVSHLTWLDCTRNGTVVNLEDAMIAVAQLRILMVLLVLLNLFGAPAWSQQAVTGLSITIVEGEGAINNVRQRVNREPIVQVEDNNRKPVAGAVVVFLLPDQGASGTFTDGSRTLMTVTDNQGRAAARGIRPNGQSGPMVIRVTASFQGLTASSVITQTNAAAASAASAAGLSTAAKWAIILGIAGGAAAAGIVVATHGGSSPSSTAPPPIVI